MSPTGDTKYDQLVKWYNTLDFHSNMHGFESHTVYAKNAACLGGEEVVLNTIDRLFGLQVRILCAAPKMLP